MRTGNGSKVWQTGLQKVVPHGILDKGYYYYFFYQLGTGRRTQGG